jgi:AraC-like DNA-binding protein
MPIYMDVHMVPGVKAQAVARAHQQDLLIQEDHACKCMTYWVDEERETVFCLIEAPDKDAVKEMHRKAHGLIPNKVIEVSNSIVQSFLGRIYDPEGAEESPEGLKIISEPSFRILLLTFTIDPVVLEHQLGKDVATDLLRKHHQLIRDNVAAFGGSEVETVGSGFVLSFSSASKAIACASAILNATEPGEAERIGFRMSMQGGEPIEKSSQLFGDTLQRAHHLGHIARHGSVVISDKVRQLLSKEHNRDEKNVVTLSPQDEGLVEAIFSSLEANWSQPDFDVEEYGQSMAMSKSQLYRKCIALTGVSPNILLKDFRLEKARELMKKQQFSISQITFESGFSSPSYFTKCFKKKYGLLPLRYVELSHV